MLQMAKKNIYDINIPEEFVNEWMKQAAENIIKAEQMDIRLRNRDDSKIDPYMLYLTGEASAEKMDVAGVDPDTKARMAVIVSVTYATKMWECWSVYAILRSHRWQSSTRACLQTRRCRCI